MRESITQEFDYGCAIACIAYVLEITYLSAAELVGKEQANITRFYVKDITNFLNSNGQSYKSIRVKQKNRKSIYKDGAIVLIRRSRLYPTGHYLIRCNDTWMDP